jgi:APA family basic amino acid/polyamine antiporter
MENQNDFKPSLKLLDATMLVAGSMIGSGIFIVAADIVRNTGSVAWLLIVWVITGFMTMTAALSYGELSAMFPKAGGQYVYLKSAYNELISFVYGWSLFAIIQTATIAAVAVAFAKFLSYLVPIVSEEILLYDGSIVTISNAQAVSLLVICLLTVINTRGVKEGKIIQTTFTFAKLVSLLGLVVFGLLAIDESVWQQNWHTPDLWELRPLNSDGSIGEYTTFLALGAIAAAMVGSIFSSDAWNNVTFIAGEIKNPQRNIGLSLALGTILVTVLYILMNLVYTGVLDLQQIAFAEKDRVAVEASKVIFGSSGTVIISIMIMVATFGCCNGLILAGARVYYSMAQDGLFFKNAKQLNNNAVPSNALWAQCLVACLWSLSGKYGDLLDMISFVVVLFYMLTIAGIFILRRKLPHQPRPYKAVGYPVLPFLYILMGTIFCSLLIIYKPNYTWPGLLIALTGVPIYYLLHKLNKSS